MALLSNGHRHRPALRRAALLLAGAFAALVGGCMVFEQMGFVEPPLAFSHAKHLEEGLACDDCHVPDEEGGGVPSMPKLAQCELCHKEIDADRPPTRQVASLFAGGALRELGGPGFSSEINFSHGHHTDMGLECSVCHRGIEESTAIDPSQRLVMEDCQRCHQGAGVDPSCATCHHEIRTNVRPPSHTNAWRHNHGMTVRGGSEGAATDCMLCHSESTCNTCHQVEMPANHNNLWRLKTHGTIAGMDRQTCLTCHRSDFCERCHEETLPLSHKGMWGAPLDQHCLSCHFPLRSNACSVCHKGTPSHKEATPLPANHNPGMNCPQCHGTVAPLPHVNKGDACIMCHK